MSEEVIDGISVEIYDEEYKRADLARGAMIAFSRKFPQIDYEFSLSSYRIWLHKRSLFEKFLDFITRLGIGEDIYWSVSGSEIYIQNDNPAVIRIAVELAKVVGVKHIKNHDYGYLRVGGK